jgi:hypothetical protein
MDTTQTDVTAFFEAYAQALTEIDLDALADCYHYPSLAVTRLGCQAIDSPDTTRDFFAQNGRAYHERGIQSVRIVRVRASYDQQGLWVGFADLENLDNAGGLVGVEHNAYQLVLVDGWRIAVTTPLDAR